jgi:hypothetical protein
MRGQAWIRLFKIPGGSVTLSRRGLGITGGIGRVRTSSRGWSYLRLGKGLYYRRRR